MKKLLSISLLIVLASALIFSSCTEPEATPTTTTPALTTTPPTTPTPSTTPTPIDQPQYGGTLKILTLCGLKAFDAPAQSTGMVDPIGINCIWESVIGFDEMGNPTPGLATSVDVSPDGKTITLHLREGVKFHDGADFNAEAVKYHMENFAMRPGSFSNVASMDIPDPYTIRLNLTKQDNALLLLLGSTFMGSINSPAALQKTPTSPESKYIEQLAGTGAFKFSEWKRDVSLKTVRFDDYWDEGKPYLDAVEVIFMSDPVTAMLSFEAGEAQVIRDLSPRNAADLRDKGYDVQSCEAYLYWLCPDSANPDSPYAKQEVREAVEYAIDKEAIVQRFGYGFNEAAYQVASPSMPFAYIPNLASPRKHDLAKAKQLLEEAGYTDGFDTTLFAQTIDDQNILTAIQGYLIEAGIRAEVEIIDPATFQQQSKGGWTNGLLYYQYGAGGMNPLSTYNWFFSASYTGIISMARLTAVTDAIAQAQIEPDPEKYEELMQTITQAFHDEATLIPLWTWPGIVATDESVHDLDMFRFDKTVWSVTDTWLSE